jgi:hypothetical protein
VCRADQIDDNAFPRVLYTYLATLPDLDHGLSCVQGFRKVHPDRWEFAHESFLRGQTHLLPRIVRRKKRGASCSTTGGGAASNGDAHHHHLEGDEVEDDREALAEEVKRLRQEQAAIGEELARMSRPLQATERRPDQLMSFLARLAEDPDGIMRSLMEQAAEKKRRRLQKLNSVPVVSPVPPPLPPPPLPLALGSAAMDCDDWQWANQKPGTMILPPSTPSPLAARCSRCRTLRPAETVARAHFPLVTTPEWKRPSRSACLARVSSKSWTSYFQNNHERRACYLCLITDCIRAFFYKPANDFSAMDRVILLSASAGILSDHCRIRT